MLLNIRVCLFVLNQSLSHNIIFILHITYTTEPFTQNLLLVSGYQLSTLHYTAIYFIYLTLTLITTRSINNCTKYLDTKYKVICDQNKSRHIATFYISTD